MKKKALARSFLSLLIVAVMIVSLFPATPAFAAKELLDHAKAFITIPEVGEPISFYVASGDDEKYSVEIESYYYVDNTHIFDDEGKVLFYHIEEGVALQPHSDYNVRIRFTPKDGYTFDKRTAYYVNGELLPDYSCYGSDFDEDDGHALRNGREYEFTTGEAKPDETDDEISIYEIPLVSLVEITMEGTVGTPAGPNETEIRFKYGDLAEYHSEDGDEVTVLAYTADAPYGAFVIVPRYACKFLFDPFDAPIDYYPYFHYCTVIANEVPVRVSPYPEAPIRDEMLYIDDSVIELDVFNGYSLVEYALFDGDILTLGWVPSSRLYKGTYEDYERDYPSDYMMVSEDSYERYYNVRPTFFYDGYDHGNMIEAVNDTRLFSSTDKGAPHYDSDGRRWLQLSKNRYVPYDDVMPYNIEQYSYARTAVVTTETAWIYSQPTSVRGTKYYGKYEPGDVISYYGRNKGFLQVYYKGAVGWVKEKATNLIGYSTAPYTPEKLLGDDFANSYPIRFYSSYDGVDGAERGTPVYIHPAEEKEYLLGYINGGYFAHLGSGGNDFLKIEYHGEAGFVPKRFQKSDTDVAKSLVKDHLFADCAASPLWNSVCDRYYKITEECSIYSYTDPTVQIGTGHAGMIVRGSADSEYANKKIINPFNEKEPYAVISNGFIEPVFPSGIEKIEELEPELPETKYFYKGQSFFTQATQYAENPSVAALSWTICNYKGEDVTSVYGGNVSGKTREKPYRVTVLYPDEQLDGGILKLFVETSGGKSFYKYYFLSMHLERDPIPDFSMLVDFEDSGFAEVWADEYGESLRFDIMKSASESLSDGVNLYDVKFEDIIVTTDAQHKIDEFTKENVSFKFGDGDELAKLIDVQKISDGAGKVTLMHAKKPKNVEAKKDVTTSVKHTTDDGMGVSLCEMTMSASSDGATSAEWFIMGESEGGNVSLAKLANDQDTLLYASSPGFEGRYFYEIPVPGNRVKITFDPATGVSTLTVCIDEYDWQDMTVDNVFFCNFSDGEGSNDLSDLAHYPNSETGNAPVTDKENGWKNTVLAEVGLVPHKKPTPDLDRLDLSPVHIHKYEEIKVEGDCEEDRTATAVCECGDEISYEKKSPHEWSEWMLTASPTLESEGEYSRVCTICGKTEMKAAEKYTDADRDGYDDLFGVAVGEPKNLANDEPPAESDYIGEPDPVEEPEPSDGPYNNMLVWFIVGGAVILAAAGLTVFFIVRSKKKKKEAKDQNGNTTVE